MRKLILNKYRNELGKAHRREYERGLRNEWCNRSSMRSYQCRPDLKSGTIMTMVNDNLVMEIIMWTSKSVDRISDNIVVTSGKASALLASSFKGFAANGNCNVIELYERE